MNPHDCTIDIEFFMEPSSHAKMMGRVEDHVTLQGNNYFVEDLVSRQFSHCFPSFPCASAGIAMTN